MIFAVSRIPLPKTERYLYWVRVALKALGIKCLFSFFGFKQRAKEVSQAHLETIPLLFITFLPAYILQAVFAVALSLFSATHPAR